MNNNNEDYDPSGVDNSNLDFEYEQNQPNPNFDYNPRSSGGFDENSAEFQPQNPRGEQSNTVSDKGPDFFEGDVPLHRQGTQQRPEETGDGIISVAELTKKMQGIDEIVCNSGKMKLEIIA